MSYRVVKIKNFPWRFKEKNKLKNQNYGKEFKL